MSYDFYSTREIKRAAKQHKCDECGKTIAAGEPYRQWSGRSDGEFWFGAVHGDCQDWAASVLYSEGDGRPFLRDADPREDIENWKEPPEVVKARLPARWLAFIESPEA